MWLCELFGNFTHALKQKQKEFCNVMLQNSFCWEKLQIIFEVPRQHFPNVPRSIFPFVDAVRTVRIGHHGENLVVLDELVYQGFRVLVMYIIVARSVHQQQVAFQVFGKSDGRAVFVAFCIFRRQAHVAFLVNIIVEALVGNWRHRHAHFVHFRIPEKCIERH